MLNGIVALCLVFSLNANNVFEQRDWNYYVNDAIDTPCSVREADRGETLPDPYDTTSWSGAYHLSNSPYYSVFGQIDDDDYYIYSTTKYEALSIEVYDVTSPVNVYIYHNSTSNLIKSYTCTSSTIFDYSHFKQYECYSSPNDTFYIRVRNYAYTTFPYTIRVNNNPGYDGISYVHSPSNNKGDQYYGQSDLLEVRYKIDSSCNIAYDSTHTFYQAYAKAVDVWNHVVGKVSLEIVSSNENVLLSLGSSSIVQAKDPEAIGITNYSFNPYFYWFQTKYNFVATSVYMINNPSFYSSYDLLVGVAVHEIGHTLGLDHYSYPYNLNIMYEYAQPFDENIGDGDIASYIYLHGV